MRSHRGRLCNVTNLFRCAPVYRYNPVQQPSRNDNPQLNYSYLEQLVVVGTQSLALSDVFLNAVRES
jgi:hypothetical protein